VLQRGLQLLQLLVLGLQGLLRLHDLFLGLKYLAAHNILLGLQVSQTHSSHATS
jgi:hypothetical protein